MQTPTSFSSVQTLTGGPPVLCLISECPRNLKPRKAQTHYLRSWICFPSGIPHLLLISSPEPEASAWTESSCPTHPNRNRGLQGGQPGLLVSSVRHTFVNTYCFTHRPLFFLNSTCHIFQFVYFCVIICLLSISSTRARGILILLTAVPLSA